MAQTLATTISVFQAVRRQGSFGTCSLSPWDSACMLPVVSLLAARQNALPLLACDTRSLSSSPQSSSPWSFGILLQCVTWCSRLFYLPIMAGRHALSMIHAGSHQYAKPYAHNSNVIQGTVYIASRSAV